MRYRNISNELHVFRHNLTVYNRLIVKLDNAPQFIGRPYSTSVSEETPVGSIIEVSPNIMVTDPDEGRNAEVTLSCLPTAVDHTESDDNICDIFDVVTDRISDGNFTAIITLMKPLDFESRSSYILTLLAVDGSPTNRLQSIATISINVVDKQVSWNKRRTQPTDSQYSHLLNSATFIGSSASVLKCPIFGDRAGEFARRLIDSNHSCNGRRHRQFPSNTTDAWRRGERLL